MANNLNSLLTRRRVLQSLLKQRNRTPERLNHELQCKIGKYKSINKNSNDANQCTDIIEESDTESPPKRKKVRKENIIIHSSSESDFNTSPISVPRSNTSFFGDDNIGDPNSPIKSTDAKKQSKVNIISIAVIKHGNSTETACLEPLVQPYQYFYNPPATSSDAQPSASCSLLPDETPCSTTIYTPAASDDAQPSALCSLLTDETPLLTTSCPHFASNDAQPSASCSLLPDETPCSTMIYPPAASDDAQTSAPCSLLPDETPCSTTIYPPAASNDAQPSASCSLLPDETSLLTTSCPHFASDDAQPSASCSLLPDETPCSTIIYPPAASDDAQTSAPCSLLPDETSLLTTSCPHFASDDAQPSASCSLLPDKTLCSTIIYPPAASDDAQPSAPCSMLPDETPCSTTIYPPAASDDDAQPSASCSLLPDETPLLTTSYPPFPSDVAQPSASCSLLPDETPCSTTIYPPAASEGAQPLASCSVLPDETPLLTTKCPPDASDDARPSASCSLRPDNKGTPEMKSNTKRKRSLLKRSLYVELLSEDEIMDFSGGSSDEWSCNESEASDSPKKKKKKRSKKETKENNVESINNRKKKKPINKRKQQKQLKDGGKSYKNKEGESVPAKTMGRNPCEPDKCKRGCYNISEDKRNSIFNFYWSLDLQRKKDWLVNCTRLVPVSRTRTPHESRRSLTYEYFINDGEDRKKVCQKFLLETLNVTQKFLLYTLSHSKEGMAQNDLRMRKVPAKYSSDDKEYVKMFIEKLPAVPSHYTRKRSSKVYLPQELKNVTNLYRIYQKQCESNDKQPVGESVFRMIFNNEYNISFHTPKKDKCVLCTKAERNEDMSEAEKKNLDTHCKEKESMYKRFSAHQKFNSLNNNTLTTSFDLQKVLTTPHGDSMLLGYSRKYAVFNFTLYESGTQNGYCYVWGECDAKRGSQEIATCLYKYFEEVDNRKVKHLILYCDSCVGQNKNKVVLSVINQFLKQSKCLENIQINFLLPGHTYMPVDSMHATIEREVQKLTVWSPSQWLPYISSARKRPRPYQVNILEHADFTNWEELASITFTKETLKKIKFQQIRIATFKKRNTNKVQIKNSMCEDALEERINLCEGSIKRKKGKGKGKGTGTGRFKGKGRGRIHDNDDDTNSEQNSIQGEELVLRKLYDRRLPISTAKYNDLKRLCEKGIIPKPYQHEYLNLPHESLQDCLIDTDEDDENDQDEN